MSDPQTSRRGFLRNAFGAGVGLLAASCTPAPVTVVTSAPAPTPAPTPSPASAAAGGEEALPDGLDVAHFKLHSRVPLTLETKRGVFGAGPITPISRFFVRNNLPMPGAEILDDRDAWRVEVLGVQRPGAVTLAELKALGLETVTMVLQCSGNGRKYYPHKPSGSKWGVGAAGCASWTGVPVRLVVEHLGGLAADARFMTATGADPLPEGIDPFEVKVERSVPAEKGMKDCLLAWEMNGEPIPLTHGGPLRLIVPGYYGCNQTKYVQTLAFGPEQTQAKIQREDYRMQPLGAKGEPHQASLWEMDLKSWVVGPGGDGEPVLQGKVQLHGVAFSEGKHRLARAELSVDGGKTWKEARWVGPDLGPYAWRNFALEVSLAPGAYEVASRVTDEAGNVQAEARVENERGYGNNSWRDMVMALEVVKELPPKAPKASPSAAAQAPAAAPSGPRATLSEAGERGRKLFVQDASPPCGACHTLGDAASQGAVGPNLDQLKPDAERVKRAVTQGIGAMPPYQGRLTEGQVSDLAAYLIEATRGK